VIVAIRRPHPAPAPPGDPTLSPTLDRTPTDPDAPEAPHVPPDLLAAGAIAAAAAAFALAPPPIAPAPPPLAEEEEDEALCVTCGLSLPATETECAFCAHARAAKGNSAAQLLRHWLVFLLAMLAVFGAGWIIAP
jgi:hypothetical protein